MICVHYTMTNHSHFNSTILLLLILLLLLLLLLLSLLLPLLFSSDSSLTAITNILLLLDTTYVVFLFWYSYDKLNLLSLTFLKSQLLFLSNSSSILIFLWLIFGANSLEELDKSSFLVYHFFPFFFCLLFFSTLFHNCFFFFSSLFSFSPQILFLPLLI